MEKYTGKSVFEGIAIGPIVVFEKAEEQIARKHISDPEEEIARFHAAKEQAIAQLQALYEKALSEIGEEHAQLFEVHQMMLDDDDFVESIETMIRQGQMNAEFAVAETARVTARTFREMQDEYMRERSADILDIADRLTKVLEGGEKEVPSFSAPSVIVADDLAPSETVQMDRSMLLAFVTRQGSVRSHTAILAHMMHVPALVQVPLPKDVKAATAIVDGFTGTLIVDPDDETLAIYREKLEAEQDKRALLEQYRGRETVTKSGRKVRLYANVAGISDVERAVDNDAAGIGLFRSEFLYLERSDFPTEEEQFEVYKKAAELMEGREVIIRTLDIGADKTIDYFPMENENNPALGRRGIRVSLAHEEIFRTQLRAIYRASAFGKISILLPMITSAREVKRAKEIMEEVRASLVEEDIPYKEDVDVGVMIETPAAVMIADELAELSDFFSIGTNDLTQYMLAVDRQNQSLENYYDSRHPAILRAIQMTIDAGHDHGIWVGICGELGGDPAMTETFVGMGIDELSMPPASILPIRRIIRNMD